jgi:hypothetical protein
VVVDPLGAGVRWKPSSNVSYTAYVTLTVMNGATIVGYIYDTAGGI